MAWIGIFGDLSAAQTQGEYQYLQLDVHKFVEATARLVAQEQDISTLRLDSPTRWTINRRLNTPGSDLPVFGLLGYFFTGSALIDDGIDFVGHLTWEEIQSGDYLSTGLNAEHSELLGWMLAQPDESIEPHQLLAKSIAICNGDVFKSLVIAWDVLSAGWTSSRRARMPRDNFPKSKKLVPIPHVRGDLFPSWYHFFGVMLYSYRMSSLSGGVYLAPEALSALVIAVEEGMGLGKRRLDSAIIRTSIDFAGARAGNILFRRLRALKKNPQATAEIAQTQPEPYISVKENSFAERVRRFQRSSLPFTQRCMQMLLNTKEPMQN